MGNSWSKRPKEDYTVTTESGHKVGIGLNPMTELPGVWNLIWLSVPRKDLDALLEWDRDPMDFPISLKIMPLCVGMSYQAPYTLEEQDAMVAPPLTVGEMAESLNPRQFLDALEKAGKKDSLLLPMLLGPAWWDIARANVAAWSASVAESRVTKVDFAAKRRAV